MKRIVLLFILTMPLSGCALALVGAGVGAHYFASQQSIEEVAEQNKTNIEKLVFGMSKRFALDIMGEKMVRAYQNGKELVINNPYKTELLEKHGKKFEILYYLTDPNGNDRIFTNDEFTPLVFENGILVGWQWSVLKKRIFS